MLSEQKQEEIRTRWERLEQKDLRTVLRLASRGPADVAALDAELRRLRGLLADCQLCLASLHADLHAWAAQPNLPRPVLVEMGQDADEIAKMLRRQKAPGWEGRE